MTLVRRLRKYACLVRCSYTVEHFRDSLIDRGYERTNGEPDRKQFRLRRRRAGWLFEWKEWVSNERGACLPTTRCLIGRVPYMHTVVSKKN